MRTINVFLDLCKAKIIADLWRPFTYIKLFNSIMFHLTKPVQQLIPIWACNRSSNSSTTSTFFSHKMGQKLFSKQSIFWVQTIEPSYKPRPLWNEKCLNAIVLCDNLLTKLKCYHMDRLTVSHFCGCATT